MTDEEPVIEMQMEVPRATDLPSAIGANYVHFTYAAGELQLLFGSFDLLDVQERIVAGQQGTRVSAEKIKPTITHRFLLSPLGVMQLRARMAELERGIAEAEQRQAGAPAK